MVAVGKVTVAQATEVSGPHGCSGRKATMRASTSGLIWYGHDNGLELLSANPASP
jgi:hypothetical protein